MVENSRLNYFIKLLKLGAAQRVEISRTEIHKKYDVNEVQPLRLSPKKYGKFFKFYEFY